MDATKVQSALASLATRRPIFHSEADFQHAFAWELQRLYGNAEVRLEVPLSSPRGTIDVLLRLHTSRIGFELKFGRGPLSGEYGAETFALREHPLPVVRFEFWADLQRLEAWVQAGVLTHGFAICLSNHDGCWKPASRPTTQDEIRFHDGRRAPRVMRLDTRPRSSKVYAPIELGSEYDCRWLHYSRLSDSRFAHFRYLLLTAVPAP